MEGDKGRLIIQVGVKNKEGEEDASCCCENVRRQN